MSRHRRSGRLVLMFALTLILWPAVIWAQESIPLTRDQLGARIERLGPRVEEAGRVADAAEQAVQDSIRAAKQAPQDTVMVGPFRIVTLKGQGEVAQEFFGGPVSEVTTLLRGSEGLFKEHVFTFSYGWRQPPVFVDDQWVYDVTMSRRYSRDRVNTRVREALGEALFNNLPPDDHGLGVVANHRTFLAQEDLSWVYRELAAAPNLAARECLEGEARWCWEAAGVVDAHGTGEDWNTPEARRSLVESRYEHYLWTEGDRLTARQILLRGCLILERDRACQLVLEGYHITYQREYRDYAFALSGPGRGTLVAEALRLGGEGSYQRLISNPDHPLPDRLAFAAGLTPNELVDHWRDRVVQSRPNAQAGLLWSPISLVFWFLLLIALAARSSRWRLG